MTQRDAAAQVLAGYVPRLVEGDPRSSSADRLLFRTGTLVSADISGFTALSERLADRGQEGAEQLTDLLNRVFAEMISACEGLGGDVIKFGGDALLVLFDDDDHARSAALAMSQMGLIVDAGWTIDGSKRVPLGISQGAHSGTFGFSLTDVGHLELLVGGPAVSETVRCEGEARRGQILVSHTTAATLPAGWLGRPTASGARPLKGGRVRSELAGRAPAVTPARLRIDGLERYLPPSLADQVTSGVPGEHRQVVVAFVHVQGVDDLFAVEGASAVHRACDRLGEQLRSVVDRHPVHVLASDAYVNGVKLIMTAGVPVSTDADDDHMLLALSDLFAMGTPLPIRAGVNRGHVFAGDLGGPTRRTFTVMGDAVNLAARLMQRAETGQIVVADAVLARAGTRFDVTELEPFVVKGKSQPIRASVLGAPIADQGHDHISHIGFVGRRPELGRLDSLMRSAVAGRGASIEITGDPGIGKSRLVREALHNLATVEIRRLRGGQYARNSPFFVVKRLLNDLLTLDGADPTEVGRQLESWIARNCPELSPWSPLVALVVGAVVGSTPEVEQLAEQFRRDRMLTATADVVDAALAGRPVAILAEDSHLFDTGSLDVLRRLAARAPDRQWAVLATHRAEPGFMGEMFDTLELAALDDAEISTLAAAAAELVGTVADPTGGRLERIASRAGGNPLFLLELFASAEQAGADAMPESVESLVTTRIDVLPAADRTLLREAAVGGAVVDAGLIAAAVQRPELADARRWAALSAFLVNDRPGVWRFRQGLYRDVAYSGLSYRRRREVHLAIAGTIESRNVANPEPVASLLSEHFDQGGDRVRAWRYSVIAGDVARKAYANREATAMYQRALRTAVEGAATLPEHARIAEALGDVHELGGHYDEAVAAYQRSRAVHRSLPEHEVRLLRKIGSVRLRQGRLSQALTWLSRASTEIAGVASPRRRRLEEAETALVRAGALHRQGRHRESVRWAEVAARAAEASEDRLAMARAYNMVEVTYRTLNRADASRYSDLALEMYAGSGDLVGEANVLNNRGVHHFFTGDWRESIDEYERSRSLRRRAGDVAGEALAANNIAETRCLQGRYAAATELFDFAESSWRSVGNAIGVVYVSANVATTTARAGSAETGLRELEHAIAEMERLGVASLVLEMEVRRVECELLADRPAVAIEHASDLVGKVSGATDGDERLAVQLQLLIGLALVQLDEVEQARRTLEAAVASAAAESAVYWEAIGRVALTGLLDRLDEDAADHHRRTAAALFERLDVESMPALVAALASSR